MPEIQSFGQILKQYRKARDLTQEALAERVACSAEMIKKVEADRLRPSKILSEHLAEALNVAPSERAEFIRLARRLPDERELLARLSLQPPPAAPAESARILVYGQQAAAGRPEYRLSDPEYLIGRDAACDIVVETKRVSRRHAVIKRDGPRYLIEDRLSSNGTFVNGRQIDRPHLLAHDDQIGLGSAEPLLIFFDPNSTAPPDAR